MHPDEAFALINGLGEISESRYFSKRNDWLYPISHESRILADTFDLLVNINNTKKKKIKPYPRPFKNKSKTSFKGSGINLEEMKALQKKMRKR